MSRLVDLTPFGARVRLKRPTEVWPAFAADLKHAETTALFDHAEISIASGLW